MINCIHDYEGLPHSEVRKLVHQLESTEKMEQMDVEVFKALELDIFSLNSPTTSIEDAINIIPRDWWWSITNMHVCIIPTVSVGGVMTNSRVYTKKGRPLEYRSLLFHDRDNISSCICAALLKAKYNLPVAYAVQAYMTTDDEFDLDNI